MGSVSITPNSSVTVLCGKTIGNPFEFVGMFDSASDDNDVDDVDESVDLRCCFVFWCLRMRRTLFTMFPTIGSLDEQHDDEPSKVMCKSD